MPIHFQYKYIAFKQIYTLKKENQTEIFPNVTKFILHIEWSRIQTTWTFGQWTG